MYAPSKRPLTCIVAGLLVATTLLTVTVAPEPAAASTNTASQTVRFPLA